MAIKDRQRRRLPRLGVIRLGKMVDNASGRGRHPVQTDYFVLHDAPDIQRYYAERGIDKVRELDVLLPFPDIERNFDAWYQVWAGGVLVCQGDGESVQYATPMNVEVDQQGRTRVHNGTGDTLVANGEAQVAFEWNGYAFEPGQDVPCPGQERDLYPHCAACRLSALLKLMMANPELFRMGYYQISTGSKRNHDTILGTLEVFPADRVNAVPFKLRLVEEQVTYNDNGKRAKTTKWFLQLEPDPTITRRLYGQQVARMLGQQPKPVAALPEGPEWEEIDPELPPTYVVAGMDAATGYSDEEPVEEDEIVAPENEAEGPQPNGARPYDPETIRAKLTTFVEDGSGAPATEKQMGLVASKLEECFAGQDGADKKRHTVLEYLFGFDSVKELRQGHVDGILRWILLSLDKDNTGDYPLHPKASAEAAGIVKAALEDAGQQSLF